MTALASTMRRVAGRSILGVRGETLARAVAANRCVATSPTMAAIERYTGVLYGELDWPSLPATQRRRAVDQLVIVSGLWGALGPLDPIPEYRLKMGAKLGRLGVMSTWWRPALSTAFGHDAVVWNLLPNEHAAAVRPHPAAGVGTDLVVRFLDDVEGVASTERRLVVVSHRNKLLKGALVRHLLRTGLDEPQGLAAFDHPLGYRYRPELTVEEADPSGRRRVTACLVRSP